MQSPLDGPFDLCNASIQTLALEREKAAVPVELRGSVVDGVDHDRPCPMRTGASDGPNQCIPQQVGPKTEPLFAAVECESGEQEDRHRVGLAPTTGR